MAVTAMTDGIDYLHTIIVALPYNDLAAHELSYSIRLHA